MEQLKWICAYCGFTFSHQPVFASDGRLCCSTDCARYLDQEIRANEPPPDIALPKKFLAGK